MSDQRILRYFLGGNTSSGFYTLCERFTPAFEDGFLWVIKGGSVCGKSSFVKALGTAAEKAGFRVEYAVCPCDTDALEGINIPELKTAYFGGTAPQLAETITAGVDSAYLDLDSYCDFEAIGRNKTELKELYSGQSTFYRKAYCALAAAGALQNGWAEEFSTKSEKEEAQKRVSGIALREFGKRHRDEGKQNRCFLSALTYGGLYSLSDTAATLCSRFYVFENRLKMAAQALKYLAQAACAAGHDVIVCADPLTPARAEAVLVPSLSLGFITDDCALNGDIDARRIRLDALADIERLKKTRADLRRCEKLSEALVCEGCEGLAGAKLLHDRIESIINPNIDFEGIGALAQKHLKALGI